jgi:insulysin
MEIIKSPHDTRNYTLCNLPNKLQLIYIEDPATEKSSAAMSVGVGFYQDPDDCPGLAHFLEHMLFMGTEKYPDENHFMEYLNKYGGMSNAMTNDEYTCYFFDIQNMQFWKALDIFAQFFIAPLLKEDSIDRECNAVQDEHVKNLTDSMWISDSILRTVSNPKYPFSKFGTGTLETLKVPNIREKLISFHHKYYSANIMKLVIISPDSFNKVEERITKAFSQVQNKDVVIPVPYGLPFEDFKEDDGLCQKIIKMVPIKDDNELSVYWQLPSDQAQYAQKPLEYISHLLGHEGDNSLDHLLKQNDLITGMISAKYLEDKKVTILTVSFVLTQKGLKAIPSILKALYQYIDIIKENGVNKWIYDELKTINKIKFDFMNRVDPIKYTMNTSLAMMRYPPEYALYGGYLFSDYTENTADLIHSYLDELSPHNAIVEISSKTFKDSVDKRDHWYDTGYSVSHCSSKLDGDFIDLNMNTTNLNIPEKNIYIPMNLNILPDRENTKHPVKLELGEKNLELWYKKDDKFEKPNCIATFAIYSNNINSSAQNYLISLIYIRMISRILTSKHYYAQMANSQTSIDLAKEYIQLSFDTYHDKLGLLFKEFTDSFFNAELTQATFDHVVEELSTNMENYKYTAPYILASEYFKEKVYQVYYNNETLVETLKNVKLEQISEFREWFSQKSYIRGLVQGNIYPETVVDLLPLLRRYLSKNKVDITYYNVLDTIEKGSEEIYIRGPYNDDESNSAILVVFEIESIKKGVTPNWAKLYCCTMMIVQMTKEAFFTQLRSIEQSGYIVRASLRSFGSHYSPLIGVSYLIQSSRKVPAVLRDRIKSFTEKTSDEIQKMSDKKLEKWKETLIKEISEENKNLYEEYSKNMSEIMSEDCMFDLVDILRQTVKDLTKQDVIDFYNHYFIDHTNRKVRVVEIYSSKGAGSAFKPTEVDE